MKKHPPAKAEAKKAADAAVPPRPGQGGPGQGRPGRQHERRQAGGLRQGRVHRRGEAGDRRARRPRTSTRPTSSASPARPTRSRPRWSGKVTEGKEESAKDITDKTGRPPRTSRGRGQGRHAARAGEGAAAARRSTRAPAMPAKAPARADRPRAAAKCETEAPMAEADVTEEQLAKSNEPEFTGAVAAKKKGEAHSAAAPAAVPRVRGRRSSRRPRQDAAGRRQGAVCAAMLGAKKAMLEPRCPRSKSAAKARTSRSGPRITDEIKGDLRQDQDRRRQDPRRPRRDGRPRSSRTGEKQAKRRLHRRPQAADGRLQGRPLLGHPRRAPLDQRHVRRACRPRRTTSSSRPRSSTRRRWRSASRRSPTSSAGS